MNKQEFIKAIADKGNFTQKESATFLDTMVETIVETLKSGDKIQLVGFGTFELKVKAAREGINPRTKQKVKIAACKNPVFKVGKSFKAMFN